MRGTGNVQLAWCFPFVFEEGPSKPWSPSSSSSPATELALICAASCLCTSSSANSHTISSSLVDNSPFNASSNSLTNTSHAAFLRHIESISVSYASKHQRRVSMMRWMLPHVLNHVLVPIASRICLTNSQQPDSVNNCLEERNNTDQGCTWVDPTKTVNPLHHWSTHWQNFHLRFSQRLCALHARQSTLPLSILCWNKRAPHVLVRTTHAPCTISCPDTSHPLPQTLLTSHCRNTLIDNCCYYCLLTTSSGMCPFPHSLGWWRRHPLSCHHHNHFVLPTVYVHLPWYLSLCLTGFLIPHHLTPFCCCHLSFRIFLKLLLGNPFIQKHL